MDNSLSLSENSAKSLTQIKVFENAEGLQCVSARELHEKLESSERFSKWWERFSSYGFESGSDFTSVPFSTVVNNGAKKEIGDYEITIEMAKQICMLQKNDKGREYREYFLQLEKAWNSPEAIMSRALQIANRTLEDAKNKIVIQQKQIEELTPDAESWRKFVDSDGSFTASNVAKLLHISRDNDLIPFLLLKKYIMRERHDNPKHAGNLVGTALGIERGYIKNYLYTNNKISRVQFKITPEGMQKIEKAFCHNELTPSEQRRVNALCQEAERKMKPTSIGRAE